MTEWRPVAGYEGFYDVGDDGRIRRLAGVIQARNMHGPMLKRWPAKELKLTPGNNGYISVELCRDGARKRVLVHVLVCQAFHGPCPPGHEAAHGNGVRTHNTKDNLRWATPLENQHDRIKHGTANRGDNAHQAILCADDIPEIRRLRKAGQTCAEIAAIYGVHLSTIGKIATGKNWAHI